MRSISSLSAMTSSTRSGWRSQKNAPMEERRRQAVVAGIAGGAVVAGALAAVALLGVVAAAETGRQLARDGVERVVRGVLGRRAPRGCARVAGRRSVARSGRAAVVGLVGRA